MRKQEGFISIILTIIITALLVGGGTYILEKNTSEELVKKAVQENTKNVQQQAQIQIEKLIERIEELEKEVVIEESANLEEGLIYKNSKYKFSLVFPDNWVGYQFEENDDGIYFGFPEQLHFWSLSIMSHQDWGAIKNEEGPKPKYIAENSDYVFTYSTGHDEVPSLQGMLFEVKDIVKTFKFTDNNTTAWQTYINDEAGFSFQYPDNIGLTLKGEQLGPGPTLWVTKELINDLPEVAPSHLDKQSALDDREALSKGDFGVINDWSQDWSQRVRQVGDTSIKTFTTFSRFEVCDVAFDRKIIFYNNDYKITLNLRNVPSYIKSSMLDYFDSPPNSCDPNGEHLDEFERYSIWDFESNDNILEDFYNTLLAGNGSEAAQSWFDPFDDIVDSIVIN